jgi:hypothetical protein
LPEILNDGGVVLGTRHALANPSTPIGPSAWLAFVYFLAARAAASSAASLRLSETEKK